jgi:hypothetical protein
MNAVLRGMDTRLQAISFKEGIIILNLSLEPGPFFHPSLFNDVKNPMITTKVLTKA